jgi:hypothetical protein
MFAVYSFDYSARAIVTVDGVSPDLSVTLSPEVATRTSGYQEILEALIEGQTYSRFVSKMTKSSLKSELLASGVEKIVVVGVSDTGGYLFGYIALGFADSSLIDDERLQTSLEITADELTQLTEVFHY